MVKYFLYSHSYVLKFNNVYRNFFKICNPYEIYCTPKQLKA